MTSGDHDGDEDGQTGQPWYNRTSAVLGVSVVGLAAIAALVLAASFIARQASAPEQAPLDFVDPTFTATAPRTTAGTTTQTITSTSPPETTEITGPSDPSSTTSPTSPSETTRTTTSDEETTTRDEGDDEDESTARPTRRPPRTNVTRTLDPYR